MPATQPHPWGLLSYVRHLQGLNRRALLQKSQSMGSPLHAAARDGAAAELARLLAAGADPSAPDDSSRFGPLHHAACGGHTECIKLLLEAGANIEARTAGDGTQLYCAAHRSQAAAVAALIAAGAQVHAACGPQRRTALHIAAADASADTLKVLLLAGADPRARDACGWEPIHYTAFSGHADAISVLLAGGLWQTMVARPSTTPQPAAGKRCCQHSWQLEPTPMLQGALASGP